MIPERYLVTGYTPIINIYGGHEVPQQIRGYLTIDKSGTAQIWVHEESGTNNYIVDLSTVEPVAVKPIQEIDEYEERYNCPNCNCSIFSRGLVDGNNYMSGMDGEYCHMCGQRLDWSV